MFATHITAADQRFKAHPEGPHLTPLEFTNALSMPGSRLYLKCEHQQQTGSFKFRGAFNKLRSLSSEEAGRGVIAASTGNHGMGVARAAQILGIDSEIYVPLHATPLKLKAIEGYGARLREIRGDCLDAEKTARADAQVDGKIFVSPYNDPAVMAGQGTIALELLAQAAEPLDAVYVAVGGGGLIGGMGVYLKEHAPSLEVIGCWPEHAPAMLRCLEAGKIIDVPEQPTLSDATAGGVEPGSITFEICRRVIDRHILLTEADIRRAMLLLAREERWLVEGSAAVALAGALKDQSRGKNAAVILCGRNITLEKFVSVVGSP